MINQVSIDEIPQKANQTKGFSALKRDLIRFVESGLPVGEVDISRYKDARTAWSPVRYRIKVDGLPLRPFVRSGRLFVMRTDMEVKGDGDV